MGMRWNTGRSGAVVAVFAMVGAVAACSTGGGGTGGAGASGGASAGGEPADVEVSDSFTSSVVGDVEQCAKVQVALGDAKPAEGGTTQLRLPLKMTNVGTADCVLRGFPGARLKGQDDVTWDLVRSAEEAKDVRLAPGASTTSYLAFLPEKGHNEKWDVTTVTITPPNTTDSQVFDWPGGSVLKQDGATRPGTYVGPVGAWGSGGA